jgi:hypothetical protein
MLQGGRKLRIENCKMKIANWRAPANAAVVRSVFQFAIYDFHFSIPSTRIVKAGVQATRRADITAAD